MCGIVGATAGRDIVPILLEGLKRLEYRGYDSAGIAVLESGEIKRARVQGKVQNLVDLIENHPISGKLGIAHTRWATHGVPCEDNAHPHMSMDSIALVHNGIVENAEDFRTELIAAGYVFSSQTDTEVIAHLLHYHFQKEGDFLKALRVVVHKLTGAYALAIICKELKEQLWGVRKGCPLIVGIGIHENFLASDRLALLPVTQQFISLEDEDIVCLNRKTVRIWDKHSKEVNRKAMESTITYDMVNKGHYRHFMQKEIFEQAFSLQNLLEQVFYHNQLKTEPFGATVEALLKKAKNIVIVACGTSYHAGLVAKYWLESMAGISCQVEIASEFRYRTPCVVPESLFISISQSGETADTLAALRYAKNLPFQGYLAICNVAESSLAHESDAIILTYAGPEIGVASTKAFTAQLLVLLLVNFCLMRLHGKNVDVMVKAVLQLPAMISEVLKLDEHLKQLAQEFTQKTSTLFLARGVNFPIAAEGALKLKELSYIHAESYPAGELKHGPLALIDHDMPVLLLAPKNQLLEKVVSNAQEIKTRDGQLFIFTDALDTFKNLGTLIPMPQVSECIEPIIYTIPMQLFSYHVAVLKGTDVDQPRNLAKSVTVE